MKIKLFRGMGKNGKPYWSMTGKNYKDSNDKITYFVRFAKCEEPTPNTQISKSGTQYQYADLDVEEMSFECYNHTPQLTIFKYSQDETSIFNQDTNEIDTSMFGGEKSKSGEYVDVKSEDLPFY